MKRNKKIIIIVFLIICCIPFAFYHIPKFVEQKQEERRIEQEEEQRKRAGKNAWYTEFLCIDGDFQVTHDSVIVSNQTIDEFELTANICFYNFFKAEDVSREMLLKEYDSFCKNKGQWEELEEYTDFMYDRDFGLVGDGIDKYTVPLKEYKNQLYNYLSVKGLDYNTISEDELKVCCDEVLSHRDELYFESMLSAINKDLNHIDKMGYTLDKADVNNSEYHGDYRTINKFDENTWYCQELTNWMTGEKEWRVVKIDVYGEGSSMLYLNIGDSKRQIKDAIGKNFNYQYITEEDDYLEYYNSLFLVRAKFEDDVCVKLSIEIMETEFTKSIGVKTIEDSPQSGRVILPLDDAENFFEGSIEIPRVLTPDENGHITIIEPRSVLNTKTDDPDELLAKAMETYEVFDIEIVDAYMNDDNSLTLVYDEEGLEQYITKIEEIYNQRLGWISNDVSISKDFTKMYIYVNDETELTDIGLETTLLIWHSVMCQVYTGVEYDEWYIDLYFINNRTGERLLEINFAEEHPGFTLSSEQWEQLFEK